MGPSVTNRGRQGHDLPVSVKPPIVIAA